MKNNICTYTNEDVKIAALHLVSGFVYVCAVFLDIFLSSRDSLIPA